MRTRRRLTSRGDGLRSRQNTQFAHPTNRVSTAADTILGQDDPDMIADAVPAELQRLGNVVVAFRVQPAEYGRVHAPTVSALYDGCLP